MLLVAMKLSPHRQNRVVSVILEKAILMIV
jgi:hypothetical protein